METIDNKWILLLASIPDTWPGWASVNICFFVCLFLAVGIRVRVVLFQATSFNERICFSGSLSSATTFISL